MGLIYFSSVILLVTTFIFLKKSDKILNFLNYLVLSFVLLICANTFFAYLLNLLSIPINLITLSIVNFIISGLFVLFIKKKGRQTYDYDKKQIIICALLGVIILFVGLFRTDFLNSISYETTDSATHFCMAFDFYKSDSLLTTDTLYKLYDGFSGSMTISYVNIGILFKAFSSIIPEWAFYKVFIMFDILMLVLSGEVFYCSVHKYLKDKAKFIPIFFFLTLFYVFGYPLNNFLFGFFYLGISIIIINALLFIYDEFRTEEKTGENNLIYKCIVLFLLNFSVFFGYYLFVPVVYAAEFIYIFIHYLIKKKIRSFEYVIINFCVLFLPFVLGFIYFLLPNYLSGGGSGAAVSPLLAEGYIYRDLYSNFIIMIPFVFYYFYWSIKNKNYDLYLITLVILGIFILGIFILGMFGKSASYYFYKNYFVLALLIFIIFAKSISLFYSEKVIALIYSCFITILLLFVAFYFNLDGKIIARNNLFNPSPKLSTYFDIYANNQIFYNREPVFNEEGLDALKFIMNEQNEIKDESGIIPLKGNLMQRYWFYALTCQNPNFNSTWELGDFYNEDFNFETYIESNYSYYICFDEKEKSELEKMSLENFEIIFQNNSVLILKRI